MNLEWAGAAGAVDIRTAGAKIWLKQYDGTFKSLLMWKTSVWSTVHLFVRVQGATQILVYTWKNVKMCEKKKGYFFQ